MRSPLPGANGRRLAAPAMAPVVVLLALLVAVSGCGAKASVSTRPKKLSGDTVAERANTQLEKQNPKLVHGELSCADVRFEKGATSRCMRTVVLDDGRVVRIGATVTIDGVENGGHFQVRVDKQPSDFGILGKAVLADLSKQYAAKFHTPAPKGSCPAYLPGQVGQKITCTLNTREGKLGVEVEVTGVDPKTFETDYTFKTAG